MTDKYEALKSEAKSFNELVAERDALAAKLTEMQVVGYYMATPHGYQFTDSKENPMPELEWPAGSGNKAWKPAYRFAEQVAGTFIDAGTK